MYTKQKIPPNPILIIKAAKLGFVTAHADPG